MIRRKISHNKVCFDFLQGWRNADHMDFGLDWQKMTPSNNLLTRWTCPPNSTEHTMNDIGLQFVQSYSLDAAVHSSIVLLIIFLCVQTSVHLSRVIYDAKRKTTRRAGRSAPYKHQSTIFGGIQYKYDQVIPTMGTGAAFHFVEHDWPLFPSLLVLFP